MPDSVLSRIVKPFRFARRHGLIRGSYYLVFAVISRFGLERWIRFSVSDIFSARVSDLPKDGRIPSAFNICFASEKDIPAIEALGSKRARVCPRFGEGDVCLLLRLGSELKATEWIAIGPREHWEDWGQLRTVFRIPAGTCWGYDGRGKAPGAWGLIMRILPRELERMGIHTIYMRIDCANPVALNSHRSAGYSPVARLFHCGVAGLGFTLCRDDQGSWHSLPAKVRDLEFTIPSSQKVSQQFKLFPVYRKR